MLNERKRGLVPLPQFLAGCFWLCLAILVLIGISSLHQEGVVGPVTFPLGLAICLAGLSVIYMFQSRKQKGIELFEGEKRDAFKMAMFVCLSLSAAFAWEKLGAFPVLLILCLTELRWIEGYPWKKVIRISLMFTAGVWLVFTKALGVRLPLGMLIRFIT
jgi:hypothetical protein